MPGENPQPGKLLSEARTALINRDRKGALNAAIEGLRYELAPEQGAELSRIAAEVLLFYGEVHNALGYAKKSREYVIASGDCRIAYNSAITLGNIFARMNDYLGAEMAWSEALTFAGMQGETGSEALPLFNMAMLDQRRGNHVRALDTLEKLRARFEKTKNLRWLASCYSRIAFSYTEIGEIDKALANLHKQEELAAKSNKKNLMANALFRRGSIYLKQDDYPKALPLLEESSRLFEELGDIKNLALVLCNLAEVHININQIEQAESELREATRLANKTDSSTAHNIIKILYAQMFTFEGQPERALDSYNEALIQAEARNDEYCLHILHESLHDVIEKFGVNLNQFKNLLGRALSNYDRRGLKREAEETEGWLAKIP